MNEKNDRLTATKQTNKSGMQGAKWSCHETELKVGTIH